VQERAMDASTVALLIVGAIVALLVLATALGSFFTIQTQQAAVIQRFGKFLRVATAGLNFKAPWIDSIVAMVDLRIQQFSALIETKTKDNVFVKIPVNVQYFIIPESVENAFYKLSNPKAQIESYVYNVILGHVPGMILDDVFFKQSEIAVDVKTQLEASMQPFGYGISKVLITDVIPDDRVKASMNSINAALRDQEAAKAQGEAKRILMVAQAEAEKQAKILQGEGIAGEREAVARGLQKSILEIKDAVPGVSETDVLAILALTQHYDTLKAIGASDHSNTILVPHTPDAVGALMGQLRNTFAVSSVMGQSATPGK
jgi:regulator of protease activity HflC (stomatin/prohibitin superfamily)